MKRGHTYVHEKRRLTHTTIACCAFRGSGSSATVKTESNFGHFEKNVFRVQACSNPIV